MDFIKFTIQFPKNGSCNFAKQFLMLLIAFCLGQTVIAQTKDLSIDMVHYSEGEISTNDTLKFEFTIKNNGNVTYPAGATLYGNLEINGIPLSFDLLGFAPSPIPLISELAPGDSVTLNYGVLLASQTIPFIPGATDSLGICLILWGDDLANIANFGGDTNPADNKTCFSYKKMSSAVNDLSKNGEAGLSIYPNPAEGNATIEFDEKTKLSQITIADLNGRVLKTSMALSNQHRMDVSNFPNGIYLVKARLENEKIVVGRLLIQH